jgi:hypothetical protein
MKIEKGQTWTLREELEKLNYGYPLSVVVARVCPPSPSDPGELIVYHISGRVGPHCMDASVLRERYRPPGMAWGQGPHLIDPNDPTQDPRNDH